MTGVKEYGIIPRCDPVYEWSVDLCGEMNGALTMMACRLADWGLSFMTRSGPCWAHCLALAVVTVDHSVISHGVWYIMSWSPVARGSSDDC